MLMNDTFVFDGDEWQVRAVDNGWPAFDKTRGAKIFFAPFLCVPSMFDSLEVKVLFTV
jgi:hypothetical protein